MEVINYLLAIDVDENNIVDTIINNYFNVDQRREFNKHIYKLYVALNYQIQNLNLLHSKKLI